MSSKEVKRRISPFSKARNAKSPKQARRGHPKVASEKNSANNSPSTSRRDIKLPRYPANIFYTNNPSPRVSRKKAARNQTSKRKLGGNALRGSPKPNLQGTRPPRSARRERMPDSPLNRSPDSSTSRQLTDIVTRVKSQPHLNRKQQKLTSKQIEQRSDIIYKEHLFATFQALKFVRTLSQPDPDQLKQKRLLLPKRSGYQSKRLVVFDLDETLVHCCDDIETSNPDFVVPITFPTGQVIDAGLNLRPYAIECLTEANKIFEVAVFTASHQCYADVVLDHIDPHRKLIHHRLYRDNCIFVDGIYVKDLRVFGNREITDIVIVDNAAYSFAYQLDSGIPIISWHDDYHDKELLNLVDYLKMLSEVEDMREVNVETFHMRTFYEDYMEEIFGAETDAMVRSRSPDIMNDLAGRKIEQV